VFNTIKNFTETGTQMKTQMTFILKVEQVCEKGKKNIMVWVEEELDQSFSLLSLHFFP
jgi:hypothetical protein